MRAERRSDGAMVGGVARTRPRWLATDLVRGKAEDPADDDHAGGETRPTCKAVKRSERGAVGEDRVMDLLEVSVAGEARSPVLGSGAGRETAT